MIKKHQPLPTVAINRPGHGGTDGPGHVDHDRVEGHGVGQLFSADHLDDERLAGRVVDHVDEPQRDGDEVQLPQLQMTAQIETSQYQSLYAGEGLGVEEDAVFAEPIGDGPAEGAEEQDRQRLHGHDEPDGKSGVGKGVHQPRLGDALHPGADLGQALTEEVVAVVADLKRREGPSDPPAGPRR